MLYSYFFNMLKVGVPGATQVPQLLVYLLLSYTLYSLPSSPLGSSGLSSPVVSGCVSGPSFFSSA